MIKIGHIVEKDYVKRDNLFASLDTKAELDKIPCGDFKTNILRMLQLSDDDSCCFDAVLYTHFGITSKTVDEYEFLDIMKKKFVPVVGTPELGDVVCMTYSETRCQHAFIVLNERAVFQKSGGGLHHSFEIVDIVGAIFPYSSKLLARTKRRCNVELDSMTVSDVLKTDDRVLCYRLRKSPLSCVVC